MTDLPPHATNPRMELELSRPVSDRLAALGPSEVQRRDHQVRSRAGVGAPLHFTDAETKAGALLRTWSSI